MPGRPFHISDVIERIIAETLRSMRRGQGKDLKNRLVRGVVEAFASHEAEGRLVLARELMDEVSKGLAEAGLCVYDVEVKTSTNLLVCSSEGVLTAPLEVGLCIDPLLSLPYIPGSSIKGVVRSYLEAGCGNDEDCKKDVARLLGTGGEGGGASLMIFADSYPVKAEELLVAPDIITPHYYRGGEPVESELDARPTPIPHVSVGEGVTYRLIIGFYPAAVAVTKKIWETIFRGSDEGVGDILKPLVLVLAALEIEGVGARTGKGYGLLEPENVLKYPSEGGLRAPSLEELGRDISGLRFRGGCVENSNV